MIKIERFSVEHDKLYAYIIDHLNRKDIVRIKISDVKENKKLAEAGLPVINEYYKSNEYGETKEEHKVLTIPEEFYRAKIDFNYWKDLLSLLRDLQTEYEFQAENETNDIDESFHIGFARCCEEVKDAMINREEYNRLRNRADFLKGQRRINNE